MRKVRNWVSSTENEMIPRRFTLKWIVIVVLVLVEAAGVASALTTFTRNILESMGVSIRAIASESASEKVEIDFVVGG